MRTCITIKHPDNKVKLGLWPCFKIIERWETFNGFTTEVQSYCTTSLQLRFCCLLKMGLQMLCLLFCLFVKSRTSAAFAASRWWEWLTKTRTLHVWLRAEERRELRRLLINPALCSADKDTKEQSRIWMRQIITITKDKVVDRALDGEFSHWSSQHGIGSKTDGVTLAGQWGLVIRQQEASICMSQGPILVNYQLPLPFKTMWWISSARRWSPGVYGCWSHDISLLGLHGGRAQATQHNSATVQK